MPESAIQPTVQQRLAGVLRHWATAIEAQTPPLGFKGQRLAFVYAGQALGHGVYDVRSLRGDITMGTVAWSNQWRAPKFTPAPDAVFDLICLAELYKFCRELK